VPSGQNALIHTNFSRSIIKAPRAHTQKYLLNAAFAI